MTSLLRKVGFPRARHTKQGSGGQGQQRSSLDALGTGHYLSPGGTRDFRGNQS